MKITFKTSSDKEVLVEVFKATYVPVWATGQDTCDICLCPLENKSGKDVGCVVVKSADGWLYRFHEKCYHKGLNNNKDLADA